MGPLAPPLCLWTLDDDLKLKKAMNKVFCLEIDKNLPAGASLESVVEGEVKFSRKFTLQELKDHRHSLQNDPDVPLETSGQVKESEFSPTRSPTSYISEFKRIEKSEFAKRRNESIGDCYHIMPKRVCKDVDQNGDEPLSAGDIVGEDDTVGTAVATPFDATSDTFNTEPFHSINDDLFGDLSSVQVNICPNYLEENGTLIGSYSIAEEVNQKDTSVFRLDTTWALEAETPVIFDQTSGNDDNEAFNIFGGGSPLPKIPILDSTAGVYFQLSHDDDVSLANSMRLDVQAQQDAALTPTAEGYLENLSNYLMDLTDVEELRYKFDGQAAIETFDLSSFLKDSPEDEDIANAVVSDAVIPPDLHPNSSSVAVSEELGGEANHSCFSEIQMSALVPAVDHEFPELCERVICCVLNTEDTDIPDNDHVFFSRCISSASSSNQRHDVKGPPIPSSKGKNDGKSDSAPQMIESQILSELGINLPFISPGFKSV